MPTEPLPPSLEPPAPEEERDDTVIGQALKISFVSFLLLIGVGLGIAWSLRSEPVQPVNNAGPVTLPKNRELPALDLPHIPFVDITDAAGIDFIHENGAAGEKLLPETMGGGCAFLDYDSDGDPDILLINSQHWPSDERAATAPPVTTKLFSNDGAGQFTDVSAAAGLDVACYGQGCAIGDYDNDGDPDVYITTVGPNRLFRNDAGQFVDITSEAHAAGGDEDWSTSSGWFDFDNDGDLDLFVCNYVTWSRERDLDQDFTLEGLGRAYGRPLNFDGAYCLLLRNDGPSGFVDVSEPAGIRIQNPDSGGPVAKALGVSFADFDRDGFLDIFVANDTVQDFLFHNQQDGTFSEVGQPWGVAFDSSGMARGGMGTDVACFRDGEACLGIAVGNFSNEMTGLYVSLPGTAYFSDEAVSNGLGPNTRLPLTFGVQFVDADLDGRLDLFATNGHLEADISKVQASQSYEQSPQLFWNAGAAYETEFVPLGEEQLGTDFVKPLVGRGSAAADIDGDGDLDLLLAACGRQPRLLRNDQQLGHHWVRFHLVDEIANRDAIGSCIDVTTSAGKTQTGFVAPTRSYLSQSETTVTLGLGAADHIDRVEITWPDGEVQVLNDVAPDRLHTIVRQRSSKVL